MLAVPWSRNFNYTPHHTVNPLFLHPLFVLFLLAQPEKKRGVIKIGIRRYYSAARTKRRSVKIEDYAVLKAKNIPYVVCLLRGWPLPYLK
jgi:hypothetical protein